MSSSITVSGISNPSPRLPHPLHIFSSDCHSSCHSPCLADYLSLFLVVYCLSIYACLIQTSKDANGATDNDENSTKRQISCILLHLLKPPFAIFPAAAENCHSVSHQAFSSMLASVVHALYMVHPDQIGNVFCCSSRAKQTSNCELPAFKKDSLC